LVAHTFVRVSQLEKRLNGQDAAAMETHLKPPQMPPQFMARPPPFPHAHGGPPPFPHGAHGGPPRTFLVQPPSVVDSEDVGEMSEPPSPRAAAPEAPESASAPAPELVPALPPAAEPVFPPAAEPVCLPVAEPVCLPAAEPEPTKPELEFEVDASAEEEAVDLEVRQRPPKRKTARRG
jgi:hypothetical protein